MAPITDLFANWPLSPLASILLAGQLLLVLVGWIIVDIRSINKLRQSLRTAQLEIAQLWKKDPLDNLKTLRDLTQADRFGLLSRPINAAILVDQANQPVGLADLTRAIEPRPIIERCPGRFWVLPIWALAVVLAVCGEIVVLLDQVSQPITTSAVSILLYAALSLLLLVGFKLADALAIHQAVTEIERFQDMLHHHFPVYTELALQHQQLLLQKQMAFHLKKMGPELSTSLGDTLQKHLVPAVRNMNQSIEQGIKHLNDEQQHGMGKLAGHFARQLDQMLGEHLTGLTASIESLNTLHESGVARTQSLLAQVERTTDLQQQAGVVSQQVLTSLTESRQELATSTEQLNQALSMGTSQISQTFSDSSAQISQVYVDSTARMNELYTTSANQFTQTLTASGDQLKSIYETSASQLSQAMINGSEQLTDSLASGSELMTASLTTASEQLTTAMSAGTEQLTTAMTTASEQLTASMSAGTEQLTTALTTGSEQLQTIYAEGTKQLQLSHATGVETINAAMSGTSERILANLTAGGEQYTQILSGFVGEFSQKLTDSTATLNQTLADGAALLTQTFDAGHSDLHQTYIKSATELNQSFAQGSSQLSETFRTSQDLLDQSRSASAEQLNLILERTGDMTTEISSLLMTNQEESSRIKQEQLAVEEQIGSYFDQMHQQIIRVQDDLQSNLIDIFSRFTDLTQTTLTQSDEQYQQMMTRLTDQSTELMNTLDEQVRELSFLVRDVSGEISGLNKTMDSSVSQLGEQLQSSTLATFQAFDQGLSSIVGQLEETIRQISDAVDDLPAAVVSVRDFVEEQTRSTDRPGFDGQ